MPQPHLTPQQRADSAAIRNFPLNMSVVQRIADVYKAGEREHLPCTNSNGRDIDAMAHALVIENPRAVPLLAKYGFTPRQFIVAIFALGSTAMVAEMMSHPGSPFAKAFAQRTHYNAKNVAFYNAHRAQITAVTQKMNGDSSCGN